MKKINARDVVKMSFSEIEQIGDDEIVTVVYDDGEIKADRNSLAVDNIMYQIFGEYIGTQYEADAITKDHTIKSMKHPTGGGITDVLGKISESIRMKGIDDTKLNDRVKEIVYKVVNDLYNFTYDRQEYMSSFSFVDITKILFDPDIMQVNDNIHLLDDDPEQAILKAWDLITKIVMKKDIPGHKGGRNYLLSALRNKLAPIVQILQMITAVGKRTDIDGSIMRKAILNGYASQMRDISDLLIDARISSLALLFQKDPLKQTEYLNRRIQLVAMYVRTVKGIDCGNTKTIERLVGKRDKTCLLGKFIKEDNGSWVALTESNIDNYIGRTVKFRSINHCLNKNRQTKCKRCIGLMVAGFPDKQNIGMNSSVSIGSGNAQNTLGVKHSVSTSVTGEIHCDDEIKRYLVPDANKTAIRFAKTISPRRKLILKLKPRKPNDTTIDPVSANGELLDLINNSKEKISGNINNLNPHEICRFDNICICLFDHRGNPINGDGGEDLHVKTGSRSASFSRDALKHMIENKHLVSVDEKGVISIDFTGYGGNKKLLVYTKKADSLLDYSTALQEIITSQGTTNNYQGFKLHHLARFEDIGQAVNYLCDFLNIKNKTNIIHAEVIVNALRCRNPEKGDFSFPDPGEDGVIGSYDEIMKNRSLGSSMAWESHQEILNRIPNYLKSDKPDQCMSHPLDELLLA